MTVNTNIMDKNNVSLGAWFEATPEYDKLIKLGVPDPVIGTIEGDIALYVEDHGIDDFNDIPEAELVAAIVDNVPDTQTRLHILWECSKAGLWGTHYQDPHDQFDTPTYAEPIDRDQAVDDDGKAVFDRYSLSVDVSASDEVAPDWRDYGFTVEDIEDFARTW